MDKSIPTSLEWRDYNNNVVQTLRPFLDNSILCIIHGFNALDHEYMAYISPFKNTTIINIAFVVDKSVPTSLEWRDYNINIAQTLRPFLDNPI